MILLLVLAGLVGRHKARGEAFHITSDEVLTWNQIYAEMVRAAGLRDPQILKVPTEFACQICPALRERLPADKALTGIFDNAKIKRIVTGIFLPQKLPHRYRGIHCMVPCRSKPAEDRHRNRFDFLCCLCSVAGTRRLASPAPRINPATPSEIRHCSWSS